MPTHNNKTALPVIEFEGEKVIPQNGVYRCPYNCGDPRYPRKKWKTERGFRRHMKNCPNKPSAVEARRIEKEKRQREKEDALSRCPYKVGDEIIYVAEVITGPTHDHLGRRIRYEPEKHYRAAKTIIRSIDYRSGYIFNGIIHIGDVYSTNEEAEEIAQRKTKAWQEHVKRSRMYR